MLWLLLGQLSTVALSLICDVSDAPVVTVTSGGGALCCLFGLLRPLP